MSTELSKEESDLVEAINLFGGTVKGLKQRRFRFTVKVAIGFGIVLAVLLAIVLYIWLVILPKVDHNTNKVKSVQCSLYRLVLTSGYHPESRIDKNRSLDEQRDNLAIYNFQYKTIVNDNNRLGCVKAEGPPKYISDPKDATTTTTTKGR